MTRRGTNRSTLADPVVRMTPKVPFIGLANPDVELEEELVRVLRSVLSTGTYVGGPVVDAFEQDFAQVCEVKHCVALASGADALQLTLAAAGVQQSQSVITVANAPAATVEGISHTGAFPEFVDIDERTYNIDPESLCKYLDTQCDTDGQTGKPTSRRSRRVISAIVPVHQYGQLANMDPILELAESYNLLVIEDASQAHGAEYFSRRSRRWMKAGSIGQAAIFSFDPKKNFSAGGDAGALTTNNSDLADKVRRLRDGAQENHDQELEGDKSRLDAIHAGFLQAKLHHLTNLNSKRRQIAEIYHQLFSRVKQIASPFEPLWSRSVYYNYVIRVNERDKLQQHLADKGVVTVIHDSVPVHLQNAYRSLGFTQGDFPVAERISREILSLPISPALTRTDQEYVVDSIIERLKMQPESAVPLEFVRSFSGQM